MTTIEVLRLVVTACGAVRASVAGSCRRAAEFEVRKVSEGREHEDLTYSTLNVKHRIPQPQPQP